jgi:hypothetical protein
VHYNFIAFVTPFLLILFKSFSSASGTLFGKCPVFSWQPSCSRQSPATWQGAIAGSCGPPLPVARLLVRVLLGSWPVSPGSFYATRSSRWFKLLIQSAERKIGRGDHPTLSRFVVQSFTHFNRFLVDSD